MQETHRYKLPIAELFTILELNTIDYESPTTSCHTVKINSGNQYVGINAFVRKTHQTAVYTFASGRQLHCSTQHIIFDRNIPTLISKCNGVDIFDGEYDNLVGIEPHTDTIVYDVALDAPHKYITPNGIIHHNTTLAKVLLNELEVNKLDILQINASNENNVDTIRNKITNFSSTMPFGDMKYVLLDECLDEDTLVIVKRKDNETLLKIKDLDETGDLVKSFNVEENRIEWKTFKLFDKGIQETLEIEFENGEVVICTPDHKWYVEGEDGNNLVVKASELHEYAHILTP